MRNSYSRSIRISLIAALFERSQSNNEEGYRIGRRENLTNKRQQKRFISRREVEFTVDNLTLNGTSSDFSLKGFFLRTNHPCVTGTVFDMRIHLPDRSISKVKGTTARSLKTPIGMEMETSVKSLKNGMGIEILEKDANYLHLIRSLL